MATLFGKNYQETGKSSSPLLLRSNGEIKLQWGNKFIDLIKNGKICSESKDFIFTIDDSENIQDNGIYLVTKDNSIWICIDGTKQQISQNDNSYISFLTKQELTPEQKDQSLVNIGLYYDSLDQITGITAGMVYIKNENKIYLIKDGQSSEYTVTTSLPKDAEFDSLKIGSITINGNQLTIDTLDTNSINCSEIVVDSITNSDNTFSIEEVNGKSVLTIDSIKWTNQKKELNLGIENKFTYSIIGNYNIITSFQNYQPETDSQDEDSSDLFYIQCNLKYNNFFEENSFVLLESTSEYKYYIYIVQTSNIMDDKQTGIKFIGNLTKSLPDKCKLKVIFSDGSEQFVTETVDGNTYYPSNFSIDKGVGITIKELQICDLDGNKLDYIVANAKQNLQLSPIEFQVIKTDSDYIVISTDNNNLYSDLLSESNCRVYQSRCNQYIQTNTYTALRTWNGNNYDYHTILGNYKESDFKEGGDTTPKFGLYSDDIKVENVSMSKAQFSDTLPTYIGETSKEIQDNQIPTMGIVKKEIEDATKDLDETTISLINKSSLSKGSIIMFDNTKEIPSKWYKCDGTNDTPDLTSMFIRKDPLDDTSDYSVIYIMKG